MKTFEQMMNEWVPCKDYWTGIRQKKHVVGNHFFYGLFLQKGCIYCMWSLNEIQEAKQEFVFKDP